MPVLTLTSLEKEGSTPKLVGGLSYDEGDSFAQFRVKLNELQMFDYDFEFWDDRLGTRMMHVLERGNKIEDYNEKVCIIPRRNNSSASLIVTSVEVEIPKCSAEHEVVSSGASNLVATQVSSGSEKPQMPTAIQPTVVASEAWMEDIECEVPLLSTEVENSLSQVRNEEGECRGDVVLVNSHELFESKLLRPDLVAWIRSSIEKLQEHMAGLKYSDHRWRVRTWDDGEVVCACFECLECNASTSCSSKGTMDKVSITQTFGNFKSSHVKSKKHHLSWCEKRKLPTSDQEIRARMKASTLDDRALFDLAIKIMERVNGEEVEVKQTFTLVGDVNREPFYLFYYRVSCSFCGDDMALVPPQRNLEHNLREHVASPRHQAAVRNSRVKKPAEGIRFGRPGRPIIVDKRDVKQKTMHKYFGSDQGRPGSSSGPPTEGNVPLDESLSQLCWGLWRATIEWGGIERPVKAILHDQLVGQVWWSEPHIERDVYCSTCDTVHSIKGLFRHRECSRVSRLGGGFEDLTCEACFNIKLQTDFRLRILREHEAVEKRGERTTQSGRRLGYLTTHEVRAQARSSSQSLAFERKRNRRYLGRICMLEMKVPSLKQMVGEAANSKDVYKFCNSIVTSHQRGRFGGREALWDMLKDIVYNLEREKTGKRYNKSTKVVCQALYQHGGRRVVDCLSMNLLGPSLNTLQRDRRGMLYYRTGLREEQFKLLAVVFSKIKERLGITGDVPVIFAEDETAIKRSVRWNAKTDALVGFCGVECKEHRCQEGLEIIVGEGEDGFDKIVGAFESQCIGSHARVIIVNPLHEAFPRLCILATTTCNRFLHDWVRMQWDTMLSMWNVYCRESVGPLIGHASDGDGRRRKLMLQDYSGKGSHNDKRCFLKWEGWNLSYSQVRRTGQSTTSFDPFGLHDQDFIHIVKRIVNPMDSPVRVLHMGSAIVTLEHLAMVYKLYHISEHGLNREDILRTDRQNWASAQRLCSSKVLKCLALLRLRGDARVEMTLGTETYLSICANYNDIFLNVRLSLRERVVLCGRVGFFFRLWRLWLIHGYHKVGGNTVLLNLDNFIPLPTFLDIQISVQFVVHLVILFRENYPYLPVPLHLTGSDVCEQFFSKVGGMRGHERNYDFCELIDAATALNRLAELDLHEGGVSVGKSHKKHKNIWMKLHPLQEGEHAANMMDYTGISTDEEVIEALKIGLKEAQDLCVQLQMCPSTSAGDQKWFKTPWVIEAKGTKQGGWRDLFMESFLDYEDELDRPRNTNSVRGNNQRKTTKKRQTNIAESLKRKNPRRGMAGNAQVEAQILQTDVVQNVHVEDPASIVEGNELFDDGCDDVQIARSEFQHCLSELLESINDHVEPTDSASDIVVGSTIDPRVSFDGMVIYKSTLVSQLVGNPTLSKDRLTRVKQSIYFNNLVDKPKDRAGAANMLMRVGDDCGVYFVEDRLAVRTSSRTNQKQRSGRVGTPTHIINGGKNERRYWLVGRVQKVRKFHLKTWGRCREPVDLFDRPKANDDGKSMCGVLFNWFTPQSSKLKFKYTMVDPLWIDIESVISVVSMKVEPDNTSVFQLDPSDAKALDDFVKASA